MRAGLLLHGSARHLGALRVGAATSRRASGAGVALLAGIPCTPRLLVTSVISFWRQEAAPELGQPSAGRVPLALARIVAQRFDYVIIDEARVNRVRYLEGTPKGSTRWIDTGWAITLFAAAAARG